MLTLGLTMPVLEDVVLNNALLSLHFSWWFLFCKTPGNFYILGTLMILKSACSNNPSYIDRLISVFMRSLQKMVREHLNPQAASGSTEATSGDVLVTGGLSPDSDEQRTDSVVQARTEL